MDEARFQAIVDKNSSMLVALLSPLARARGGQGVFYNAYFNGTEVVVLGYQVDEGGGHSRTKPVAIMVDEEVFDQLRVDDESSRVDGSGRDTEKKVL